MITRNVNIIDTNSANLFLRALWYSIRNEFGKLAWQYDPLVINKTNNLKQLKLGNIDINLNETIEVSILFISKGTIKDIIFNCNLSNEISKKINNAIDKALNYDTLRKQFIYSANLKTDYPFFNYQSDFFSIVECKNKSNKIIIKIQGFDSIDCKTIVKEKFEYIRDILASHAWRVISFEKDDEIITDNAFNTKYFDKNDDSMWDDEHAIFDNRITLPKNIIYLIEKIINLDNYTSEITRFLNAARLFHNGLKIEQNYLRKASDIDWFEWVQVNFISSLEILSIPHEPNYEKCDSCGQMKYSIVKRVKEFVTKYFPNREDIIKFISSEYQRRSSLVHEGNHFSNRNYMGVSMPQIEKSDYYVRSQIFINPNLKYFFGNCFKMYLENEITNI